MTSRKLQVKKIVIIIGMCLALMMVLFIVIKWLDNLALKERQKGEDAAIPVGVVRAKQECAKEGLDTEVCESVKGTAITTECLGKACWLVYAKSKDQYEFTAVVTVEDKSNSIKATEYSRYTSEPLN